MSTATARRQAGRASGAMLAIAAIVGAQAAGAVAALWRWSAWWPHSDIRQVWAIFAGGALAVLGLATLAAALWRTRGLARVAILVLTAVAVLVGLTVGFAMLQGATASARKTVPSHSPSAPGVTEADSSPGPGPPTSARPR